MAKKSMVKCEDCGAPMKRDSAEFHQICIFCKNQRAIDLFMNKQYIKPRLRCYLLFHQIYSIREFGHACLTCMRKRCEREE